MIYQFIFLQKKYSPSLKVILSDIIKKHLSLINPLKGVLQSRQAKRRMLGMA